MSGCKINAQVVNNFEGPPKGPFSGNRAENICPQYEGPSRNTSDLREAEPHRLFLAAMYRPYRRPNAESYGESNLTKMPKSVNRSRPSETQANCQAHVAVNHMLFHKSEMTRPAAVAHRISQPRFAVTIAAASRSSEWTRRPAATR